MFSSIPWVAHQCLILKFIEIKFTKTLIVDPIAVDKPLPEVYVVETVLYKIYSVIISAMLGLCNVLLIFEIEYCADYIFNNIQICRKLY